MQPDASVQDIFGEYPYWNLIASVGDFAIFLLDRDGRIVSWNEGARLLFDYQREEIVGQHFRVLFAPEDREKGIPEGKLQRASTHGRAEDARWHIKKDGTRIWVNGVTTGVFDEKGRVRGFSKIVRDDTVLKQREEALLESRERFELLSRATNEVIWDWNLDTDRVWWNDNLETLFGYSPESRDDSPDWWKEHVHPEDYDRVVETIHHVIDGKQQVWSSEYRFLCANGSYAFVTDRGYVQREVSGRPYRILGTMQDITDQRRWEEERRIFERLTDNSPDYIGICDMEGNTLYLNETALRLAGVESLEVAQRIPIVEFVFPEDRPFLLNDFLPRVLREGIGSTEIRFRNQSTGDGVWMNYVLFLVRDAKGEAVALATVSRDITARRQSEVEREELLHNLEFERKRLTTIFQNVPAFVSLFRGPNYVYELTNPAYYQLIGHRDVIGKPVLEALPEIAGQGFIERLNGVFYTGTPFEGREVPVKLRREPNGPLEERFISLLYQPFREADGSISGVFSHGFDITEQVRARRRAEDATHEAQAATQEANDARRQAEEINRIKDEFLATLSHELRTPLNSILGWANLLQTGQLSDEDATRGLATIERSARAQTQLIEDILDVSRVITGKMRLDVQSVDLSSVIEEAVSSVLPATVAKEIRLQRVLDSGASIVAGDPARLQQIVWNLLSNAIKFTPRGGRVQIRLERVNSHVEIIVADTGTGIAPQVLPLVFDRFRQADSSSTRAHGGLGLGLAIVRHLAELHGGTIEAHSPGVGQGAVFTLKLPLSVVRPLDVGEDSESRVHPRTNVSVKKDDLPPLDGLHILIADDQEDTRLFLGVLLKKQGASVTSVGSATEAFMALQALRPDVLLSDIGMPGEDGYSLIKRVRALSPEQGGQTPAAALTAFARVEDRVKALRAGFQSHIPKPVEPLELVTVVANLAGRHGEP